jgi:LysM repeat protein
MENRWRRALLAGIVLSLFTVGALGQTAAAVKVFPGEATVPVGQNIEVTIQVENITSLFGIELSITFDANFLEVVDADPNKPGTQITAGGFLSRDFEATNDVADGVINYALQQVSPHSPVSGNGVLARITFRGKAGGTSNVTLDDVFLSDQVGNGLTSVLHGGVLVVTPASGVVPTATPSFPTPTPIPPKPQPTATQPPASAAPSTSYNCAVVQGYHTVKRDETLYAIARTYATDPYAISACNHLVDPRRIHASNRLAIPYAPWEHIPAGPTVERQFGPSLIPAPVPTPEPGCRAYHTIQPVETLIAIGLRYGVNIWDIARANRIYNLNLINAGQVLCIP